MRWLLVALIMSYLEAAQPLWMWHRDLTLAKEQNYRAKIVLEQTQKPFSMRWTLYKNYGLVMHIAYDSFRYQVILCWIWGMPSKAQNYIFFLRIFRTKRLCYTFI